MAYTRIHAVKATIDKSVAYICNPDKTDGNLLVSSFSCSPETAKFDFKTALSKTSSKDVNLAYHLIQSFAPKEVSDEEAHRIGKELADRLLMGNYSYVIATHNDRDHIHNHIIFCAADNVDHRKFNSCKRSYYRIRQLSDELCKEHGLSVIETSDRKGKTYTEWKADREGKSWKTQIRNDIDEVIKTAGTYEEFLILIKDRGYEIKGEDFGEGSLKYIAFKAPGQQRFIRGSLRSLGQKYTREEIRNRIENREQCIVVSYQTAHPFQKDILKRTNTERALIDTSGEKFQNSPGLEHWAKIRNLQIAAKSYAEAENLDGLRGKIKAKFKEENAARAELAAIERQLRDLKELKYYLDQYRDNLPFHEKYKKSKDPDRYMRMHESQIILFDGAGNKLKQMGITPKMSLLNQVNTDLEELTARQAELEKKYRSASKERKALEQKLENITKYLGIDNKDIEKPVEKKENMLSKRNPDGKKRGGRE